jgi:hypothetical protein
MKINIAEALNAAKIKKVATSLTSLHRKQPSVRGIVDRMKNGIEPSSKEILSLKKDIQDEVVMAFAKEFGPEETMKKFKVVIDEAKLQKSKDDPCWDSHVQLGTKKKNGKEVPNCVPKEEVELDEVTMSNSEKAFDLKKKAEAAKKNILKFQKNSSDHDKLLKSKTTFTNIMKRLKQMDLPKPELDALRKGTNVSEGASPMIKDPEKRVFNDKSSAFAYKAKHGGKVQKRIYTDSRSGRQSISYQVVKEENDTTEKLEMAQTQLHFIYYAAEEILDYIDEGGEVEEWYQNKLSKVHSDMESLHSYVEGEMRRTGMKEETKLDPVNKSELKKKFHARKDKDIDNDGDVDSSDEYLHNRRKAISKNVKEGYKVPSNYAALMLKKKKAQQKAAAKEKWGKDDAEYLKKNTQKEETDLNEMQDRYIRAHGKKAQGKGKWSFTDSRMGKGKEYAHPTQDTLDAAATAARKALNTQKVYVMEKLDAGADAGEYIKDFKDSDAPQFKGKTKEKRRQMAIAAYMSKKK